MASGLFSSVTTVMEAGRNCSNCSFTFVSVLPVSTMSSTIITCLSRMSSFNPIIWVTLPVERKFWYDDTRINVTSQLMVRHLNKSLKKINEPFSTPISSGSLSAKFRLMPSAISVTFVWISAFEISVLKYLSLTFTLLFCDIENNIENVVLFS